MDDFCWVEDIPIPLGYEMLWIGPNWCAVKSMWMTKCPFSRVILNDSKCLSGDTWTDPDPNAAPYGKSVGSYNPQESLEKTIVPWVFTSCCYMWINVHPINGIKKNFITSTTPDLVAILCLSFRIMKMVIQTATTHQTSHDLGSSRVCLRIVRHAVVRFQPGFTTSSSKRPLQHGNLGFGGGCKLSN